MSRLRRPWFSRVLAALPVLAAMMACASPSGRPAETPLAGTRWRLAELGGQPALPGAGTQEPHLDFAADSGRVSGSSGCNRFGGTYAGETGALTFGPLMSTKMACADDRLNRQEVDFLGALAGTKRYAVAGDTLTLLGDAGPLARLVAATP